MKRLTALFLALVLFVSLAPTAMATESSAGGGEENISSTGEHMLADVQMAPVSAQATVEFATPEPAQVMVAMYDDASGKLIGFGMAEVTGGSGMRQVPVDLRMSGERPTYFSLRAFLLGGDNVPLCQSLDCFTYTRDFREFMNTTAEDFPNLQTVESGDNNLVVLADGVIHLAAGTHFSALHVDEETGAFTLSDAVDAALQLRSGDRLWITDDSGAFQSIRAGSVTYPGGDAVITPDETAALEDFVAFIRMDMVTDQSAVTDQVEQAISLMEGYEPLPAAASARSGGTTSTSQSVTLGGTYKVNDNLSVKVTGEMLFEVRTKIYYKNPELVAGSGGGGGGNWDENGGSGEGSGGGGGEGWDESGGSSSGGGNGGDGGGSWEDDGGAGGGGGGWGSDEEKQFLKDPYVRTENTFKLSATVTVTGTSKDSVKTAIPIVPDMSIPVSPVVAINVGVELPMSAALQGVASAGWEYESKSTSVSHKGKTESYNATSGEDPTFDVSAELVLQVGLKARVGVTLVVLRVQFVFEAGIKLKAVLDPTLGPPTGARKHLCTLCLSGDVTPSVSLSIEILLAYAKWKIPLAGAKLMEMKGSMKVFYLSNVKGFNWGSCDNFAYRLRVYVYGEEHEELTGADVVVSGEKGGASLTHGGEDYLPKGEYHIEVACADYKGTSRNITLINGNDETFTLEPNDENFDYGGSIITDPICYWYGLRSYMILRPSGLLTFQGDEPPEWAQLGNLRGNQPYWRQVSGNNVRWERIRTIRRAVWLDGSMSVLPNQAFENCMNLESVDINGAATPLGNNAFAYCKKLTLVEGTRNVTTLGNSVFHSCAITGTLDLSGAENYGYEAVGYCEDLEGALLGRGTLGGNAFINCSSLRYVDLGEITSIGSSAFSGCSSLQSVDIPETVTSVGNHAFEGSGLTAVTIPASVESLGWGVFRNCPDLTSATINVPGLTVIDNSMFSGCPSLQNVSYASGVERIGSNAFANCTALESYVIPETVTSVEMFAFDGCSNLQQLYVPAGVTNLDSSCIYGCDSLTRIDYGGTMEQWQAMQRNVYSPIDTTYITVFCRDGVIGR